MTGRPTSEELLGALHVLARAAPGAVVEVDSGAGGMALRLACTEIMPEEVRLRLAGPFDASQGLRFSPAEAAILTVATADYQPAATLAEKAKLASRSADLLPIMRNMVERGLLESAQGRGFRLAPSRATTEAAEEATGTYHTEAQP